MKKISFYWVFIACLAFSSCGGNGDAHPEVQQLYNAITSHTDFEYTRLFKSKSLISYDIVGSHLIVSYLNPKGNDSSATQTAGLEVWNDGDSLFAFEMPVRWSYFKMVKDGNDDIYAGKYRLRAPHYNRFEVLPVITRDYMEVSLYRLQEVLCGVNMKLSDADIVDVYGADYDTTKTDSLTSQLFGHYERDSTSLDSVYRQHLYYLFRNCNWYIDGDNFSIIDYGKHTLFWEKGREPNSVTSMQTQFYELGGQYMHASQLGYMSPLFDDNIEYENETSEVYVTEYDDVIAEWKLEGFGAGHVGGILWLNPEYIWYYEVEIDDETKMRFKVLENTPEEDITTFPYYTSRKEFYILNPQQNSIERIRYNHKD